MRRERSRCPDLIIVALVDINVRVVPTPTIARIASETIVILYRMRIELVIVIFECNEEQKTQKRFFLLFTGI